MDNIIKLKMNLRGSSPIYDNEIAINGLLAKEKGLIIGDTIALSIGANSHNYIITGFIQSANNGGRDGQITLQGYRELIPDYNPDMVYVYLDQVVNTDRLTKEMENDYKEQVDLVLNLKDQADSSL